MARSDFEATAGEEGYDPFEIHTRSQDEHGHTFSPRAHMPKTMGAIVGAFLASPLFPEYNSPAAFIRDAVYHRAKFWETQQERDSLPAGARLLRIYEVETRATEYRAMLKQVDKMLDEMDDTVRVALAAGDTKIAEQTLNEYEDLANEEFEEPHTGKILDRVALQRTKLKRF
jgi:hypothetical protein